MAVSGPEPESDVRKWQREHGESTGRSDLYLVVTEGGEEIKIPVSRGVLAFSSGLVRDLPHDEDVPIIGDHTASTVVAFCKLCYPFIRGRLSDLSFHGPSSQYMPGLRAIAAVTRLAHWMDAPDVVDLLFGQLTVELEETNSISESHLSRIVTRMMTLSRLMTFIMLGFVPQTTEAERLAGLAAPRADSMLHAPMRSEGLPRARA